jgi:hypothetical protein
MLETHMLLHEPPKKDEPDQNHSDPKIKQIRATSLITPLCLVIAAIPPIVAIYCFVTKSLFLLPAILASASITPTALFIAILAVGYAGDSKKDEDE